MYINIMPSLLTLSLDTHISETMINLEGSGRWGVHTNHVVAEWAFLDLALVTRRFPSSITVSGTLGVIFSFAEVITVSISMACSLEAETLVVSETCFAGVVFCELETTEVDATTGASESPVSSVPSSCRWLEDVLDEAGEGSSSTCATTFVATLFGFVAAVGCRTLAPCCCVCNSGVYHLYRTIWTIRQNICKKIGKRE